MRTILILVSLLIIGNTVIAQNSNEKFTLGQCLDFAINNSYATHRANLDVIEAGYQINEAPVECVTTDKCFGQLRT